MMFSADTSREGSAKFRVAGTPMAYSRPVSAPRKDRHLRDSRRGRGRSR